MLVGDPPYMGSTAQAVLGQIIAGKPVTAIEKRAAVPAHVDAVIRKALEKVAADRFATASELATALNDSGFRYGESVGVGEGGDVRKWKIATAVSAAMALLAVGWASFTSPPTTSQSARSVRLEVPRPWEDLRSIDIAPDGGQLLFTFVDSATEEGREATSRMWLQGWDGLPPSAVQGTEGAGSGTFSPDGRQLAFIADGDLKLLDLSGGRPRTIVPDIDFAYMVWGDDGFIYGSFYTTRRPTIVRVPEGGGAEEQVTTEVAGFVHYRPSLLPGGRGVLYSSSLRASGDITADSVAVLDLSTGEQQSIFPGSYAEYLPTGHLLVQTWENQLLAVPFDLETLTVTGDAVVVTDDVSAFQLSAVGDLVYIDGTPVKSDTEAVWLDRDGTRTNIDSFPPGPVPEDPALSPDGSLLALTVSESGTRRLVIKDLEDGTVLTLEEAIRVAWSADSREVGFSAPVDGGNVLMRRRADGSGQPTALTGVLSGWDIGRWGLDQPIILGTETGLAVLTLGQDTVPASLLEVGVAHDNATLSPDGRWVAFEAGAPRASRIFVRPFPDVESAQIPVSSQGGVAQDPQWSADGHTLYYTQPRSPGTDLVAARVATEPSFEVLDRVVFAQYQAGAWNTGGWLYDVAPDGERAVVTAFRFQLGELRGLVLVEDFVGDLRRRLSQGN
jgi:serine/threonine-protein kinase